MPIPVKRRATDAELHAAAVILAALLTLPRDLWIAALAIVCRAHWDGRLDELDQEMAP